jgi:hypothetical protein
MPKKKIQAGLYEYKGFHIRKNVFSEYGMPSSAWVVTEPKGDELGPSWTLKGAIDWIKSIIEYY